MKNIFSIIIFTFVLSSTVFAAEKMPIAIMDFEPKDVTRMEASKISELIRNEMINSGKYTVIERAQVDKILREQGFQMTGCTDVSCAVQVGKLLSARKILVGTVMRFGGKTAITGRIVDVEKGVAEFSEKEVAESQDDMLGAAERFSEKLSGRIMEKTTRHNTSSTKKKTTGTSTFDPVSDPFPWIGLGLGVASGACFTGGYLNYFKTVDKLEKEYNLSRKTVIFNLSIPAATPGVINYTIYDMLKKRKRVDDALKTRNMIYIAGGAVGGAALLSLFTYIGRYIYYKTAKNDLGDAGSIALFIPPQYLNTAEWTGRKAFGIGMGLSMRF